MYTLHNMKNKDKHDIRFLTRSNTNPKGLQQDIRKNNSIIIYSHQRTPKVRKEGLQRRPLNLRMMNMLLLGLQ